MSRTRTLLLSLAALSLAGCLSSQTPQASDQVAKQFSGGPMPPDVQKKFQESMKKNQDLARKNAPGGKP